MGLGFSCQGKVAKSYRQEQGDTHLKEILPGAAKLGLLSKPISHRKAGELHVSKGKSFFFSLCLIALKTKQNTPKQLVSCGECDLPVAALQKKLAAKKSNVIKKGEEKKFHKNIKEKLSYVYAGLTPSYPALLGVRHAIHTPC